MKVLPDVHITYKLKNFLLLQGFKARHVNQILQQVQTTDKAICNYADVNDLLW